jgi:hypothetical protein
MTPLPILNNLLSELRQSTVRDLAWVLLAPPLLSQLPGQQRYPLQASCWGQQSYELSTWLLALDADSWLLQKPVRRLGLYYERLWQFALHAAPDVEVLSANLPIRQQGHTLGELDLLLRDTQGAHHLELAVKFYLARTDSDGTHLADWLGPGSHDRLDIKLDHLITHQLPLSCSPQAQESLNALQISQPEPSLWLSGYLFYPWNQACCGPQGHNPQHLRGRWLHHRQWPGFVEENPGQWQLLDRQAWLAPARLSADQLWRAEEFEAWRQALKNDANAQLLVRLTRAENTDWFEQERVFLVNDDWPQQP